VRGAAPSLPTARALSCASRRRAAVLVS